MGRGFTYSMLSDDLVAQILNKISESEDIRSFSEVCKQWLRVQRLNQTSLRVDVGFPQILLTRFPNLQELRVWEVTKEKPSKEAWYPTETELEIVAKSCPNLETLLVSSEYSVLGSKGLRALGNGCPKLSTVMFDEMVVGNEGLVALFQAAHNLKGLHLSSNELVSDYACRAIGSSCITTLELKDCPYVTTDVGLRFVANGTTSGTLKKLILDGCQGITDNGIEYLVKMRCLEHLELTNLSEGVTDVGGVAISTIQTLKELKLSEALGMSDRTVVALAENCHNLEAFALCLWFHGDVSGASICAFSGHKCLKHLALFGDNIHMSDVEVERIVLGCPSLESLVLDDSVVWNFGSMQDRARRVIKFGSYDRPLPHFTGTTWW
ncbi:hypothetical protein ACLB2K_070405 [Fragaria x ananassa]